VVCCQNYSVVTVTLHLLPQQLVHSDTDISHFHDKLTDGYSQSKWVAETIVRKVGFPILPALLCLMLALCQAMKEMTLESLHHVLR
jgi:hypothetical protein